MHTLRSIKRICCCCCWSYLRLSILFDWTAAAVALCDRKMFLSVFVYLLNTRNIGIAVWRDKSAKYRRCIFYLDICTVKGIYCPLNGSAIKLSSIVGPAKKKQSKRWCHISSYIKRDSFSSPCVSRNFVVRLRSQMLRSGFMYKYLTQERSGNVYAWPVWLFCDQLYRVAYRDNWLESNRIEAFMYYYSI